LLHVVPPHVSRIRHVGFLANCTKKVRLAQCRRLLNAAPPPVPPTRTMAIVARVPTVRDRPVMGPTTLAFEDTS
jgi:hypothetical protein